MGSSRDGRSYVRFLGSDIVHLLDNSEPDPVTLCGRKRVKTFGLWNFYPEPYYRVITCLRCKKKDKVENE